MVHFDSSPEWYVKLLIGDIIQSQTKPIRMPNKYCWVIRHLQRGHIIVVCGVPNCDSYQTVCKQSLLGACTKKAFYRNSMVLVMFWSWTLFSPCIHIEGTPHRNMCGSRIYLCHIYAVWCNIVSYSILYNMFKAYWKSQLQHCPISENIA